MNPKNNQHFVWKHYLRKWSINNRDIYNITPSSKKISLDSINGLARMHRFYQSSFLNSLQIEFLKKMSEQFHPAAHAHNMAILQEYLEIQNRQEFINHSKISDPGILRIMDTLNTNFLEDLHAEHESEAKSAFDKLSAGDITPLTRDHEILPFIIYLCHQFVRTNTIKQNILKNSHPDVLEIIETAWWIISYMMGNNFGFNMNSDKNLNRCILKNISSYNFITSDNPAINIHSELKFNSSDAPTKIDLFFPLTPRYAFMINESDRFSSGINEVDDDFVKTVNELIAINSGVSVYGHDSSDIKPYISEIGKISNIIGTSK